MSAHGGAQVSSIRNAQGHQLRLAARSPVLQPVCSHQFHTVMTSPFIIGGEHYRTLFRIHPWAELLRYINLQAWFQAVLNAEAQQLAKQRSVYFPGSQRCTTTQCNCSTIKMLPRAKGSTLLLHQLTWVSIMGLNLSCTTFWEHCTIITESQLLLNITPMFSSSERKNS